LPFRYTQSSPFLSQRVSPLLPFSLHKHSIPYLFDK
jgi:hypothetical protein